jgi:hypothetical protein
LNLADDAPIIGSGDCRTACLRPMRMGVCVRSLAGVAMAALLVLGACAGAGASRRPSDPIPSGLPDDHILLAIDYLVDEPVLDGVYDPRLVNLTAAGTLVHERRDVDATFGTTVAKLDATALGSIWAAIGRSGVATDRDLELPGFMSQHGPHTATVFRVDDGTRSTRLRIASLGSEGVYPGDPPVPADELALRAAATQLKNELRAIQGEDPWTPPALLLWWRRELPGDWNATVVTWPLPLDLASAGHAIDHPVWSRCARLEGDDAAVVARFSHTLPIDHLVELAGARYALDVRAIHPDELAEVACPSR